MRKITLTVSESLYVCVFQSVEKSSLEVLITGQSKTSYCKSFYKKPVASKLVQTRHMNFNNIASFTAIYKIQTPHLCALTFFLWSLLRTSKSQKMTILLLLIQILLVDGFSFLVIQDF